MAGFWARLPVGRVARLVGASPEALGLALETLPDGAPATVTCHPLVPAPAARTVAAVLDQLEAVAVGLFPAWLPGAGGLDGPQGARVPAVRALALRQGAATPRFGPFLADLAERSVTGQPHASGGPPGSRYAAEVRAASVARVVADSFGRSHTALLVQVPDGLAPADEQALVAACEWLAQHGGFGAWLTGAELRAADRVPAVPVRLPAHLADLPGQDGHPQAPGTPAVHFPALAGRPHPASRAEQALEAALATRPWAAGRVWNRAYRPDPLTPEIRVDLMWEAERCAVEIDGPEHRGALRYEADRRRDVQLQLAGFAVLRFTNPQIEHDLAAVLAQLEQLVTTRRQGRIEYVQ